jgi:hypothetical protein
MSVKVHVDDVTSAMNTPGRPTISSTWVDAETRPEQAAVTVVAATSATSFAETTLTVTQLAQTLIPSATEVCWSCAGSKSCQQILKDFIKCYEYTGNTDPNGDDGRSETFQRCLCVNLEGDVYKK